MQIEKLDNSEEYAKCPWCEGMVVIKSRNCCIFRHGVDKNWNQLPPHSGEDFCMKKVTTGRGCGKPFRIVNDTLVRCDYDT
jgi:DNA-directed RNA polymerase subunit RPC12/RpoP